MPNRGDETSSTHAIACPRCGYDLRGIVAMWEDACPLEGRCSECGLTFEWRRVYQENEHPWLFEYHWRRRPVVSFLRTYWLNLRPWRFWSELDLFYEARIRPLLAMLAVVLLTCGVIEYGSAVIRESVWRTRSVWYARAAGNLWWDAAEQLVEDRLGMGAILLALVWLIVFPTMFLLIPSTLKASRIRRIHLARAMLYSLLAVLSLYLIADYVLWMLNLDWYVSYRARMALREIGNQAGWPLVWILRDVFNLHGFSRADGSVLAFSLVHGFVVVPYWWFVCTRYLKLESAGVVLGVLSFVASLIMLCFVVLFG